MNGASLGDLGASFATAEGRVENLESLSDFEGQYWALEAGATAGPGVSVLTMRNSKGVVITLDATHKGGRLTLGAEGLRISLE